MGTFFVRTIKKKTEDTLDEKHIEEMQTEKTSQTEEQEQIPTGNTEVQLENSVEKYSAETEQQRYIK